MSGQTNQRFDSAMIAPVIEYMNADHRDSLLNYAQVFAGIAWTPGCQMTALTNDALKLLCIAGARQQCVFIAFQPPLPRAAQIRGALIGHARKARQIREPAAQ